MPKRRKPSTTHPYERTIRDKRPKTNFITTSPPPPPIQSRPRQTADLDDKQLTDETLQQQKQYKRPVYR